MLRLEQLGKTFDGREGRVEAVRDVSLTVKAGEIYGIIGASGAGKSTLVRCINLLERPEQGSVWMDDIELTALGEQQLRQVRRGIGMIFQHFNLMASRTVLDNVLLPLRDAALPRPQAVDKARSLLKLVGLSDKEAAYPSQLSGGQKQRVAIARALANDPKLLLCDEATSALDPQTTLSILALLKQLNEQLGLTIVLITHEMAVIKEICHRVAVMEDGRVVEQGDVYGVFAHPREHVTRRFIDTASPLQKIYRLLAADSPILRLQIGEQLLRLKFHRQSAAQPYISEISRRFLLDMNIIFGDIDILQDAPLGSLVVIVRGQPEDVARATEYLRQSDVDVEVMKRA